MQITPTNISRQSNIKNNELLQAHKTYVVDPQRQEVKEQSVTPAAINNISVSANKYEYTVEDAKEAGQSEQINWERLEKEFGKLEMGFSERASLPIEDFVQRMDFAASRYAVLKDRIINTSPLSEKKDNLDRIDRIAQGAVNRIKESYASFLTDELGNWAMGSKIKASVDAAFEAKTKQYAATIRRNPEYASITEGKDVWLKNDDAYMASQLRKHTKITEEQTISLYSMNELKAAGSAALQFSKIKGKQVYAGLSEEEMGMDLAVLGMQTEYLIDKSGMKQELAKTVRAAEQEFIGNYMDAQDQGWKRAVENDQYGLIKPQILDRNAVLKQYEYTMEAYHKKEDFVDAIHAGAKQAWKTFKVKYDSADYAENGRYSERSYEDLKHFFERESSELSNIGYMEESSTYEKYLTVISSFCETVDQEEYGSVNFEFQPWGMKEANPEGTLSYADYFQKIDVRV